MTEQTLDERAVDLQLFNSACVFLSDNERAMATLVSDLHTALKKADAENTRLRKMVLEAMEWNWMDDDAPERFNLDE